MQNFRNIEQIQVEGHFKLRKIFTVRNKLQPDVEYQGAPSLALQQHHASASCMTDNDSSQQTKQRAGQRGQEQPKDIYSNVRPQENVEAFSATPDFIVDDYTQPAAVEDEIASQQKPKGRRAAQAAYENQQSTAGGARGPASATKGSGGYHEPVPPKMDFPHGVKHQSQLIDFKTVLRIQETLNQL